MTKRAQAQAPKSPNQPSSVEGYVVQPGDVISGVTSSIEELYTFVFHDVFVEDVKILRSLDPQMLIATETGVAATVVGNGATALHTFGNFNSMPWAFTETNLQIASLANNVGLANNIVGGMLELSDGKLPLQQMVGLTATGAQIALTADGMPAAGLAVGTAGGVYSATLWNPPLWMVPMMFEATGMRWP
jgi:hypothetical protein